MQTQRIDSMSGFNPLSTPGTANLIHVVDYKANENKQHNQSRLSTEIIDLTNQAVSVFGLKDN